MPLQHSLFLLRAIPTLPRNKMNRYQAENILQKPSHLLKLPTKSSHRHALLLDGPLFANVQFAVVGSATIKRQSERRTPPRP